MSKTGQVDMPSQARYRYLSRPGFAESGKEWAVKQELFAF